VVAIAGRKRKYTATPACGTSAVIAQAHVYPGGPGLVARCPVCAEVVLRLVRGPDRAWLDLRGVTCLQLAVPPA